MSEGDAAPELGQEFALEYLGGGCYRRVIDERWGNANNAIFGGYAAAVCLAAAAAESRHAALCSAHIMFLAPTKPGSIELAVTSERQGRSFSALRVLGLQGERHVLAANAWFWPATGSSESLPLQGPPPPSPSQATAIPWLDDYPFYRWMETLALDYPDRMDRFVTADYRPIDVWSRPRGASLPPGLMTQLYDVLLADAHTADGAARWPGFYPEATISLDLHMQWAAGLHQPGWRRLTATAIPPLDGLSASSATICDDKGRVCATSSQQAWSRHNG